MKKIVLSIIFFVFLFLASSSSAYATKWNAECWRKYMQDEMAACGQVSLKCIFACPGKDIREHNVCLNKCSQEGDACNKRASAGYKACAGEGTQVPLLSPKPTQSSSNNCWSTHMVDQMAVCSQTHLKCTNKCVPLDSDARIACFNACDDPAKACREQSSVDYSACVAAERQAQKQNEDTLNNDKNKLSDKFDERACHESCQSDYDTCTSDCKTSEIFSNSDTKSSSADCSNECNAEYNHVYESIRKGCFDTWWSCGIAIKNTKGCGGISACGIEEKCNKPYEACLQPANDAKDKCLRDCGVETNNKSSNGDCNKTCEQTRSTCSQSCRDAAQASNVKPPSREPSVKPSVGVSSKDFRALARANAEYQKAQADLEKIKADNDPRWEAKKDFAGKYNTQLSTDNDTLEKRLADVRKPLERIKDGASVYLDVKEIYDLYKGKPAGPYGGVSLIADVGNGIIKYTDLRTKGVSVEDATTKTMIDTVGTSAFYLYPPLKVADMAATIPDRIMNTFGFDENDPIRKWTTGLLKNSAAPSSFIEKTTDAMITTQNRLNMGIILNMAIDDVKSAEGFVDTVKEGFNLVGTFVGAVPVAAALEVKEKVSTVISAGGKVVDFVSSWFTYPDN